MLDNTIVLPVDVLGNAVLVNKTYLRDESVPNRSVYTGPGHTLSLRSLMNCYRTQPKKSGNFPGVAKGEIKITQDTSVPGVDTSTSIIAPRLASASTSFPVGTSDAEMVETLQTLIAALKHEIGLLVLGKNQY